MIRSLTIVSVLGLLIVPDDETLLTWDGRKYTGTITPSGEEMIVRTLTATHRILVEDVACIFEQPREIVDRAAREFGDAKLLYDEAVQLAEINPVRNEKLHLAIEKTRTAVKLYRLAEPFTTTLAPAGFGRKVQTLLQFLRLARGGLSSERAGIRTAEPPRVLALADPHFAFEPPEAAVATWTYSDALGPGQAALSEALVNPDAGKRREAVRLLSHPPAPIHLPDLMKTLESETDADVIAELATGLRLFDTASYVPTLGWVKRDADPGKVSIVLAIARAAGTRSAFEFLADWFVESPPDTNEDRAAFASCFRAYREKSVSRLKGLLAKHKRRALQSEILMQMGALRDPGLVGMLVNAIPAYPNEAPAALLKIGKPALPYILKGFGSSDQKIRKQCITICRKITGLRKINADHFEKWWAANRRDVLAEEKKWWAAQEVAGFTVSSREFRAYGKGRKRG